LAKAHRGQLLYAAHEGDIAALERDSDGTNDSLERPLVSLAEIVIDLQRTVERALVRPAEVLGQ
jgi:hypothetical protein